MMTSVIQFIERAVGFTNPLWFTQLFYMIFRGAIIYLFGLTFARFNKKLMGIRTPFNFILFVMLGSISANAIAMRDLFLPTIGTLFFLSMLNGLMTILSYRFRSVELFVKGRDVIIVKNGKIQWNAMKNDFITERELMNELHAKLHTHNLDEIETATLASDGTINFILKKQK
ncbi:TPA: hypothetical protein DIC20_00995 [Candidatus Dependentiae bacterium]|nr:MAG: putative membrane associated protein [candidate division TM6 bacterium GW2011_GWF2_36_131]KKQ03624.1 MAG: putative membrane associated protein [candidate division TM6 bacterium GW2011_GWE2_36_25]KKQ18068.1 MAG: putative membrane associated protein [candidate division TM6 bacterium GW2011_GWA2_36_9]HBR70644.1 hypothetical protein [Candidatus Dependentiae bacterium]HCU00264.1 hypothetical protein [Candidatus Dependentiae bacterium]